jgi:heme-degrading monooxygenase HmoA
MHARKRTLKVAPHKVEAAVSDFKDNHLHKFREQKGFKGVTILGNRDTGELTAISFWATEEDVHGSADLGRDAGESVSKAGDGEADTGGEVLDVLVDDTA